MACPSFITSPKLYQMERYLVLCLLITPLQKTGGALSRWLL